MPRRTASGGPAQDAAVRRQIRTAIRASLRDLRVQLTLLNHRIGKRLMLKDIELDRLDALAAEVPLSPSLLARRLHLHPATLTGILDRLESGSWVARDRDGTDRRGVRIRPRPDRAAEIYGLYRGMNGAMNSVCARYTTEELGIIADFLQRSSRPHSPPQQN